MLLPVPRLEAHPKAFGSLFNLVYIGFANNSARAELFVASICRDYVIDFLTTFAGRTSNLERKTNTA
jgi:hypothetical protein